MTMEQITLRAKVILISGLGDNLSVSSMADEELQEEGYTSLFILDVRGNIIGLEVYDESMRTVVTLKNEQVLR